MLRRIPSKERESNKLKIAVLITCFNRKNITLTCIQKVMNSNTKNFSTDIFVVDGGSTDGTALAILEKYPQIDVQVLQGLYWNRGMIAAWEKAANSQVNYDAFLLLNDDVHLYEDAISELVKLLDIENGNNITVGFTVSPTTGAISYGGLKRQAGFSRIRFQRSSSNNDEIVTMNGNCVLVPRMIYQNLGMLSSRFQHSFGDIDYGLRATKAGISIVLTREPVAKMETNETAYSSSQKLSIAEVISLMKHPKGLPIYEWLYFCYKHAGIFWPINFLSRYLRITKL